MWLGWIIVWLLEGAVDCKMAICRKYRLRLLLLSQILLRPAPILLMETTTTCFHPTTESILLDRDEKWPRSHSGCWLSCWQKDLGTETSEKWKEDRGLGRALVLSWQERILVFLASSYLLRIEISLGWATLRHFILESLESVEFIQNICAADYSAVDSIMQQSCRRDARPAVKSEFRFWLHF